MLYNNKRLFRIVFFVSIILLGTESSNAQFFTSKDDPSRARWREIKSENYRLIYPRECDSLARIYISNLEKWRPYVIKGQMINPEPIPVVLHPYTTMSNGLVSWAPKRMELVTTPDMYDGSADWWEEHLAIHESRHVAQVEHYTRGIYKTFYYLIGEQVTGIGLGLFTSKFTLEGDAVVAETQMTRSGRGRSADFLRHTRALYLEQDFRSRDRMLFGSYHDYYSNHYVYGYLLESFIAYKTNDFYFPGKNHAIIRQRWYDIPTLLDPAKTITGIGRNNYFKQSQQELHYVFKNDLLKRGKLTHPSPLSGKRERLYANYTNPILITCMESKYNNGVIALKEGMEYSDIMVYIDSLGREHFIRHFNPVHSRLTYDGKRYIYWSETVSKEASGYEDFSLIYRLDLNTGKVRNLGDWKKLFNPAPSPTSGNLAAVSFTVEGESYLVVLDSSTGEEIYRKRAAENGIAKETTYIGETIYCTTVTKEGMAIYALDSPQSEWRRVSDLQYQSITGMKSADDFLYFTSDLDGVLNIYNYYPDSDSLVRVTNSKFGSDYPFYTGEGNLLLSEYDLKGYHLCTLEREAMTDKQMDFTKPYIHPLASVVTEQYRQNTKDIQPVVDTVEYKSKYYSKFLHAWRFHSWYPLYLDMSVLNTLSFDKLHKVAMPGVMLLSQNSHGTVVTKLGYCWNWESGFHSGHASVNAKLFWDMELEASFDINDRNRYSYKVFHTPKGANLRIDKTGDMTPLTILSVNLYYPLRVNSLGWYRTFVPQIRYAFSNDKFFSYASDGYIFRNDLRIGLQYGQVIPTAKSQIFPRWGFGFKLFGGTALDCGENFGEIAYADAYLYLPGFMHTHGIKLTGTFQQQFSSGKNYRLGSYASLPRGFGSQFLPTDTYFKVTADYAFPIWLGDVSLGPVLYLQRLQVIPFCDYAKDFNSFSRKSQEYLSYGCDLLVNFHLLRFGFPFCAGVRYSRTSPLEGQKRDHFNILFNLSF